MTDANTIANAYIAAWNETDPAKRSTLLDAVFAKDASYLDPLMAANSREDIGGLIAGVQQRFPGFRFTLWGKPDGFADRVRFSWLLGPEGVEAPIEGTDFVTVADGKIASVTGFLDKVPAA
jgi:hypothetical protein